MTRLVMAAGGTGGHMFPAQALAEEMLGRGWAVTLMTDARGARYTGAFPEAVEIETVSSATFARGGVLAKAIVPFSITAGILAARRKFRALAPACVIGFGGYPSIPAMAAAWSLGLPRLIHEQNGVLGRVNQLFARRVDAIACGTWPTELPGGVMAHDIGNPVRGAIRDVAGAPYLAPCSGRTEILILGGSQGARILSDVVPPAIAALPSDMRALLHVSHQAREEDVARVTASYAEAGIAADVQTFFSDVPERLSQAQLLISRSGASTVADCAVIGRPAIFIPLASAIRDEQTANARALVEAGAARIMPEAGLTPEALASAITAILTDPSRAKNMARAALSLGKPDAAAHLADLVAETAGQTP